MNNFLTAFFRGRSAANHNPGPFEKDDFSMATVTKFAAMGQPEIGTVHWFNSCVERGNHEAFAVQAQISPGLAGVMLLANPNNRNLSERKVDQYARDMLEGRWTFNGEPIIIGDTGELNDGQHRLQALIQANRTQTFFLVFGVPRESRTTLDQGMARCASHYLAMDGVENAKLAASIANFVTAFERSGGTVTKSDSTHAAIVARVKSDEGIARAAQFTNGLRRFTAGFLTPAQIGGCFYLFADICPEDARDYLTQVCIGENIRRRDPAFTVRHALESMRGDRRRDRVEAVFRGWIAYRQGRKLDHIKIRNALPALV